MQMILSRTVLIVALSLFGYFITLITTGTGATRARSRPEDVQVDFAQLASQLTSYSPAPAIIPVAHHHAEKGDLRTSHHIDVHDGPLDSVAGNTAPPVQASLRRGSDNYPFQLISPEITGTTELIPGRWKARPRLLLEAEQTTEIAPDPWISGLQTTQLDWQIDALSTPRETTFPLRHRSSRQ